MASARQRAFARAHSDQLEKEIYRKYYTENDFFLSPEGLLKVISAIVCIVSAVVFLSAGGCASAPGMAAGAGAVALLSAASLAVLYAGPALDLPLYAPEAWLYTDIIMSTVMGVLLLVTAVLSMTVCELNNFASYIHGPLSVITAGMVTASAVTTYVSVMRRQDAARHSREPVAATPAELDV